MTMTHAVARSTQLASITIGRRFNGPVDSANGGYAAGSVARFVGGPARVALRKPPPLDTALDVQRADGTVRAMHAGEVIAEGRAVEPSVLVPPARPTWTEAEAARAAHPWIGIENVFSHCFACAPGRADGLRVTPGPLATDPEITATTFSPDPSVADANGVLPTEIVWAALDCPSYPARALRGEVRCLLGTLAVTQQRALTAEERFVVVGWTVSVAGRKHHSAAALIDGDGEVAAQSEAIWIAVD